MMHLLVQQLIFEPALDCLTMFFPVRDFQDPESLILDKHVYNYFLLLFSGKENGCCLGRNGRGTWSIMAVVSHTFHFTGKVNLDN